MRTGAWAVVVMVVGAAALADADPMLDIAIGAGMNHRFETSYKPLDPTTFGPTATAGLGWHVHDIELGGRVSIVYSTGADERGHTISRTMILIGPSMQWSLSPGVWLGGGAGLRIGRWSTSEITAIDQGVGVEARIGTGVVAANGDRVDLFAQVAFSNPFDGVFEPAPKPQLSVSVLVGYQLR